MNGKALTIIFALEIYIRLRRKISRLPSGNISFIFGLNEEYVGSVSLSCHWVIEFKLFFSIRFRLQDFWSVPPIGPVLYKLDVICWWSWEHFYEKHFFGAGEKIVLWVEIKVEQFDELDILMSNLEFLVITWTDIIPKVWVGIEWFRVWGVARQVWIIVHV